MLVAYEFVGAGLVQNSNVGAGFKIQTWRPDPKFKHDCPRWGPDTVFQTVVYKNYILYYVYTYCIIYQKYYLQFLARTILMAENPELAIRDVYAQFKRSSMGGCDGRSCGCNGSLAPIWLSRVFEMLGIFGQRLVDLGAGEGRVLVAALVCGAHNVLGYELPENQGSKYLFDSVLKTMDCINDNPDPSFYTKRACWQPQDIDQVGKGFEGLSFHLKKLFVLKFIFGRCVQFKTKQLVFSLSGTECLTTRKFMFFDCV